MLLPFIISGLPDQFKLCTLLRKYLHEVNIHITDQSLSNELKMEPDFPEFNAVHRWLDKKGIKHKFLKLQPSILFKINLPVLIRLNDGKYAILKAITESHFEIIEHRTKTKLTTEDLLDLWDGVSLIAETSQDGHDTEFPTSNKLGKYLLWLAILAAAIYTSILYFRQSSILLLVTFLSISGTALSLIALLRDFGLSLWATYTCSAFGAKKEACNQLQQYHPELLPGIKWSSAGLAYFISIVLSAIMLPQFGIQNSIILLLTLTSFGLPVTAYSIYRQIRSTNRFCPLCMSINTLQLGCFGLLLYKGYEMYPIVLSSQSIVTAITVLLTSLGITILIISYVSMSKQLIDQNKKLGKVMETKGIQSLILDNEETRVNTQTVPSHELNTQLLVLLSLNCHHCRKTYNEVIELIDTKHYSDYKIIVTDLTSRSKPYATLAIALGILEKKNIRLRNELLRIWYSQTGTPDPHVFLQTHLPNFKVNEEAVNDYKQMIRWVINNADNTFPQVYLNGKSLPQHFTINDFLY